MEYRRAKMTGGTYFFALATHHRRSLLCKADSIVLLRESFKSVMARHSFKVDAAVILPTTEEGAGGLAAMVLGSLYSG
jgi:putative transposase